MILNWGVENLGTVAGSYYIWPGSGLISTAPVSFRVPQDMLINNLQVHQAAIPGGAAVTYELWLNGSPTGLSVSLDGDTSDGSDLVNSFDAPAGSLISLVATVPSGLTSGIRMVCISAEGT